MRPRCVRSLFDCFTVAIALTACGTTTKEPSRAATSAPPPQTANELESLHAPAAAAPMQEESAPDTAGGQQLPRAPSATTHDDERSKRAQRADARDLGTVTPAKAKAAGAPERKESSRGALASPPAAPAAPAGNDTPQLSAAIVEFDNAYDQLNTSRGCDDGCRALASMRRAAQRICDIVISNDPQERCRIARSRLDGATKDLNAKCSCS
jgi:hypothetical protein